MVEGLLEVLEVEVEQLGDQMEQAVQNWSLEELSRPYSRLSSLNQQLQHQAALRSDTQSCYCSITLHLVCSILIMLWWMETGSIMLPWSHSVNCGLHLFFSFGLYLLKLKNMILRQVLQL